MSELKTPPPTYSTVGSAPPDTANRFYGWWIVLIGTAILFVSSGIGFYGHRVILDPLRTLHGWS